MGSNLDLLWDTEAREKFTPRDEWMPLYWTKSKLPLSRGDAYANLAKATFKLSRGFKEGEAFETTEWQKFALNSIFEEKLDGTLRYRQFLLGLPRKNGKSLICSSIVLTALLVSGSGKQIYSASLTMKQAKIVFNEVVRSIRANKYLEKYLKVTESENKVTNRITGSVYSVIAADGDMAQGFAPYLVIFDEIHALHSTKENDFWKALTEGSPDQKESLIIAITTAGNRAEGLLPTLFGRLKELHDEPSDSSNFGGIWWGASEDADISDPEVWALANPNIPLGLYDLEELTQAYETAEATGDLNNFVRFRLNQFVQSGNDSENFMPPEIFNMNYESGCRIAKGSKIWIGFDGSVSNDSTVFVAVDERGVIEVLGLWEDDGSKSWFVPKDEVNEKMEWIMNNYDVQKVYCDDSFFQSEVQKWGSTYRNKVDRIPQSASRMVPMTNDFYLSWTAKELKHNGGKELTKHFHNAKRYADGRAKKATKDSKDKIDIVIATILAVAARRKTMPNTDKAERLKAMREKLNRR